MTRAAVLLAALLLASPAAGESILARSYTSAKLDELWTGTLGREPPGVARFALLAPAGGAPEPVRVVPVADFGLPFEGEVIGETAAPTGTAEVRAFPVIPMLAEDAGVLSRRLAWAEIYLSRYRFYEAVSTDDAAVLTALTQRQYAAALEAWLVSARLYFADPELAGKCRHLTRAAEIAAGPLSGMTAAVLPPEWQALAPIQASAAARLGGDVLAATVCGVAPVRGRAETIRIVETRVRERIMAEVRAKVGDTLQLLEAASTAFQTLVNDMDVPIRSAEILELERVLGNAAANIVLVKEDQLKAEATITTLQAVDLSALNQPEALQEFADGKARMDAMVVLIEAVMAALADLSALSADPALQAELAPCAKLRGAYAALDLNRDTGALTQAINGPYTECLGRARALVARFQQPSRDKALMAELARQVRQISETLLATVSP